MLIYGSFALMVRHWIPWVILVFIWTFVFMTNIAAQEASLSRYPEWDQYKERAGLLLPRMFRRRVSDPGPGRSREVRT
jgi:protein-S-isoprenylcysteine O-methyltransferase Ste14